jgi:hypothetical protein
MTTAEFTLRLICVQPNQKDRLAWLEGFFKLYSVTEKPALLAAINPDANPLLNQSLHQLQDTKLPQGYHPLINPLK